MSNSEMKTCTKCGTEYPATSEYFSSDKNKRDGLRPSCKQCRKRLDDSRRDQINAYKRDYAKKNPEKKREADHNYYIKYHDEIKQRARKRRNENIDEYREKERKYVETHREHINQKMRERRSENREEVNRKNKEYRDGAPEKYSASQHKHYLKNRDYILKHNRDYQINHPEKLRVIKRRHKDRKRELPTTFTDLDWKRALDYWNGCCAYCGESKHLHMEHYIPLKDPNCPGTIPTNILPACKSCNCSKKSTEANLWLKRRFGEDHAYAIIERVSQYFIWVQRTA